MHDRYLPVAPLRPFERRGLLEVVGTWNGVALTLVAARFASDRTSLREWRFTRGVLRRASERALFFADGVSPELARIGVADLGFVSRMDPPCAVYRRDESSRALSQ